MAKSWEEVKSVLDDPYVSADTKEALLSAYVMEAGDDASSEVEDYTDGTKAEYNLKGDLTPFQYRSTDDIYDSAREESEESGYSARLNDENVEDGRTTIEDMQVPTEGSRTSVEKSDEIFDAARPALRMFEDFLPVNDKVPGDQLGRYGRISLEDIQTRYDEQMGISFKNFLDDAARLRTAYTTLTELNGSTETELNSLYRKWTGPAANASFQHWSEKLSPPIKDLLEYLETAPDMIGTAVTNIFTACKDKANDIIALYQNLNGTMGSATPEIAMKVVNLANGEFDDEDHDKVLEVAAWVDSVTGSNLEDTVRDDNCDMNEENREYVISECKKWIRDSFNEDLHETVYVNFKQACDDALEAVNLHYETLNNYLKEYESEFGEAAPPGSQTPPPGTNTPPPGSNTPPPSSSTPPPGSSTPPPGSADPSSSAPPPISTPPSSTSPNSVPPLNTDLPGTSTNPSSTNPSSIAPAPLPGVNTPGATIPSAIDPVTGLPIGTPGSSLPGGAPKEATIKDGDRTITVGQPDARGRSKVTVDDGKGEPREYEVDFTPDQPGETYEDGVLKAGPDGKVVIQDGDAAITLEQPPGRSDQMKMTVDDGTPATYDFDFDAGPEVPAPGLPDVSTPGSMGGDGTGPGGAGGGGAGGGIGGGGGFGGADTPGPSATPAPGGMVGANAPETGGSGGERGGAVPAAASAGAGGPSGQQGGMMGGMPMGGMGAGGGQGGDQARQSKWRTSGSIFDDPDPAANFSGVVGRDPSEKPKAPKR